MWCWWTSCFEWKTLIEMGYNNVKNVGGIGDWEKNNGPMDK